MLRVTYYMHYYNRQEEIDFEEGNKWNGEREKLCLYIFAEGFLNSINEVLMITIDTVENDRGTNNLQD